MELKHRIIGTIAVTTLFRAFAFGTLWSFLILYMTTKLHMGLPFAGLYIMVAGVTGAAFQLFSGAITDAFGRKKVLLIGQTGQGLAFIAIGIALISGDLFLVLGTLLVQSIFGGMVFSTFNAIIADVLDENERFRGYAIQRGVANIGWGIGPAIGGVLYALNYYTYSFFLIGIALISVVLIISKIPETNISTKLFRFSDIPAALLNHKFLLYSIAGFISFLVFGQLNSTYPVYEIVVNHIPTYIVGLTWTMNGFVIGTLQYYVSRYAKTQNAYYFLIFGMLTYGLGYFMLVFYSTISWLFVSMLVITGGELVFSTALMASAVNMAPRQDVGKYTGTFGLFTSIGRATGPVYGGLVFYLSISYMFRWGIIFATAAVSSMLYFLVLIMLNLSAKKNYMGKKRA